MDCKHDKFRFAQGVMLERRESGVYSHLATQNKWEAWQASRATIEIELPESFTMHSGRTPYLYVSEVLRASAPLESK